MQVGRGGQAAGAAGRAGSAKHQHTRTGPPSSGCPSPPEYSDGLHPLQLLLDHQMPRPAYLSDAAWNIVGYNRAMAQWFPWVLKPRANLMRWVLLDPDDQEQYVEWEEHARISLAMVRMALVKHDRLPELVSVLNEVLADEDCRRIWDSKPEFLCGRGQQRSRRASTAARGDPTASVLGARFLRGGTLTGRLFPR
ncbi:hypothetical protein ACFCXH_38715 [Streptomyces nojiriensis]